MGLLDRLLKKQRPPVVAELLKPAEQGDREAQCKLGFAYADGKGMEQNFEQACRWFELAARQGHPEAQFSLGVLTESGEGTTQDSAQAAAWFRKASAKPSSGLVAHIKLARACRKSPPKQ